MKKLTLIIVLAFLIHTNVSSQPCLPEGITFTTQTQIDNFQSNYPTCTEIEGDMTISGDDITNLSGLSVLTSIGGDLMIWDNISLTSLTGLENLTSIGGSLSMGVYYTWENFSFFGNPTLISISALSNLTSIGADLNIIGNSSLTNLTGLENITSIGSLEIVLNDSLTSLTGIQNLASIEGNLIIGFHYLVWPSLGLPYFITLGNPSLVNLSALDNVTSIGGGVSITGTDSLASLTGLENLTSIGGFLTVWDNSSLSSFVGLESLTTIGGGLSVFYNSSLSSFVALEGLTSIGGNLRVAGNNSLTSLTGLDNLTSIDGYLAIGEYWSGLLNPYIGNPALTNLAGLEGLTSIGGGISIRCNLALINLTGLDNLTSIGGSLMIGGNNALTSLTGLGNVTSIEGDLSIGYLGQYFPIGNPALISLTGLENIEAASINSLSIYENISLSTCEVQSICDYLLSPNGTIEIHDNAPGCDSQEEVEEACGIVNVNEFKIQNSTFNIQTYPNPFSTSTTIEYELSQPGTVRITIYNQFGAQVEIIEQSQEQGLNKVVWTPKNLSNGIYYFRLQAGEQVAQGKMVLMR